MNRELEKLSTRLTANKLSFNLSKTHYMVFDRDKEKKFEQYSLLLLNILIDKVKYTNFMNNYRRTVKLDLYLTSKLNFLKDLT